MATKGKFMQRFLLGFAMITFIQFPIFSFASDSGRRFDNLSFLRDGAGARAQALAGAFTARADDATAPFWNPAFIESFGAYETQVAFMALPLTLERRASYAAYIQKLGNNLGSIGASWNYYRIGKIEKRDSEGALLGDMEDLQNAFGLSYGLGLNMHWKIGGSIKLYYHQLADQNARGVGFDVAAAYKPRGDWLRWEFGATLKELSPGINWSTGRHEAVDPGLRLGAAYHIIYERLIAAMDLEMNWQQKMIPHIGIELWAWEPMAARMGMDSLGVYFGLGYRYGPYQFDYSYSVLLEGLSDEHRITIMYKL
jgi:hypothetical protein